MNGIWDEIDPKSINYFNCLYILYIYKNTFVNTHIKNDLLLFASLNWTSQTKTLPLPKPDEFKLEIIAIFPSSK